MRFSCPFRSPSSHFFGIQISCSIPCFLVGKSLPQDTTSYMTYGSVSKPCTPVVHIKIAGKWMFIPLKMVLIGIDPYPYHTPSYTYADIRHFCCLTKFKYTCLSCLLFLAENTPPPSTLKLPAAHFTMQVQSYTGSGVSILFSGDLHPSRLMWNPKMVLPCTSFRKIVCETQCLGLYLNFSRG